MIEEEMVKTFTSYLNKFTLRMINSLGERNGRKLKNFEDSIEGRL